MLIPRRPATLQAAVICLCLSLPWIALGGGIVAHLTGSVKPLSAMMLGEPRFGLEPKFGYNYCKETHLKRSLGVGNDAERCRRSLN
jgi:hypothetical protein